MSTLAEEKIRKARMQLVAQHPFFSTLVLSMEFVEVEKGDMRLETMGTDGKRIYYVPEFVEKLGLLELMGVLTHEAMHAALLHPYRASLGVYNKEKANVAMDIAVNNLILAEGFVMPGKPVTWDQMRMGATGHLTDPQYKDQPWEQIYRQLADMPEQPDCGHGQPQPGCQQCEGGQQGQQPGRQRFRIAGGQKGLSNDVLPNNSPSDETETKINTQKAATVARQQGKLPAGMEHLLDDLLQPQIKWFEVLKHWMKSKRKEDYDPRRYNRRMAAAGVYLPTLYSEGMGPMVVVRDTSGSCLGDQEEFLAEIAAIMMDTRPDKLILIDCDSTVYESSVKEFKFNEGDLLVAQAKEFTGGGGTSFKPPFKYIEKNQIHPEVMVFLTDLYGDFPDHAPGYPVMWVVTGDNPEKAPFGMTLYLKEGQKKKK